MSRSRFYRSFGGGSSSGGLWGVAVQPQATQAVGHTYGPNVWPQPDWAGSGGLALSHMTIAGGELSSDGSGNQATCDMASPPTFVAGDVWNFTIPITSNGEDAGQVGLRIGGATPSFGGVLPLSGTISGTITVPATPVQIARILDGQNDSGFTVGAGMVLRKQLT